jgi:beta-phosphoglucomutase-like phosphatase (HAD superfamily)
VPGKRILETDLKSQQARDSAGKVPGLRRESTATAKSGLELLGSIHACLQGVRTDTAMFHASAWKEMFDGLLSTSKRLSGHALVMFDVVRGFQPYIDGGPRDERRQSLLASRGLQLPKGIVDDLATAESIQMTREAKDQRPAQINTKPGIEAYSGSVRNVRVVKQTDVRTPALSSSKNCHEVVLADANAELFDARIDRVVLAEEHLAGKPDTYLTVVRALTVTPAQAAVFEDVRAGVAVSRAVRFCFVVGVDREGQVHGLRRHGAEVVTELAGLLEAR